MNKKLFGSLVLLSIFTTPVFAKLEVVDWECSEKPSGVIKNVGRKEYSYVQVTIPLKNNGSKVGDARANVAGLGPGETWSFEAFAFGKTFDTCGGPKVSGF